MIYLIFFFLVPITSVVGFSAVVYSKETYELVFSYAHKDRTAALCSFVASVYAWSLWCLLVFFAYYASANHL